ncbi:MAG: penicillin-binding protein 2 [Candidatus Omnitrophica bacterium]|nr:penicillin-binding protein 2 [Candidatus Omnitrophota bacterium]
MRIRILQIFFTILFILVGICLYYLQIIKGPFYDDLSARNSIRLLNITAPRGNIYDRHGKLIAGNTLSFGVFIVPQETDDIDADMEELSGILGVSKSLLERNYKRNRSASFAPCELIRGISKKTAISIEESRFNMPGVLVKEVPFRNYYYEGAFSHVIGYIGEIDQLELELLKPYGYNIKDLIGKDGVERFCDRILRGKNGGMQIQVDNRGRQVKVMSYRRPKIGRDVYLTLDAGLQKEVYNLFGGQRGAAIFMDPRNGEILSLVSSPSYDPNSSLTDTMRAKESPLLNRVIMGVYPPGSIFKIITSVAALESKKIRPDTGFVCAGKIKIGKYELNCWNRDGHGYVDFEKAIAWSCNVYFCHAGLLTGADKISEYAGLFGLGKKTGIELFGESSGFVPSREWKRVEKKEVWYPGDTANLSIGQGDLLVTPLQIARMVAGIANGGSLVQPHILKRIGDADITNFKTENLKLAKEDVDAVKRGMRRVTEDIDGTGNSAASKIVSISAKTGTVQVGRGIVPHGWFAGFAPSENPKICFAVFLENGGSGGDMPAGIAKLALEYWFRKHKND